MVFMYNLEREERTKRRKEQSNPLKNTLSKLIQNIDILELRQEYRNRPDKAEYLSSDYFQLEKIEEQQEKIKEKLSLP